MIDDVWWYDWMALWIVQASISKKKMLFYQESVTVFTNNIVLAKNKWIDQWVMMIDGAFE